LRPGFTLKRTLLNAVIALLPSSACLRCAPYTCREPDDTAERPNRLIPIIDKQALFLKKALE
jgi:hypothetical protein